MQMKTALMVLVLGGGLVTASAHAQSKADRIREAKEQARRDNQAAASPPLRSSGATKAKKPNRKHSAAWSGPGRFNVPTTVGDLRPFLTETRGLIRPVYELRGLLLQTRLLLLASTLTPADRKIVDPWIAADPADVGWLTVQLDRLRDASTDEQTFIKSQTMASIGSLAEYGRLEKNLDILVGLPMLEPEHPLVVDPTVVAGLAGSEDLQAHFISMSERLADLTKQFIRIPTAAPKALKSAQRFAQQTGQAAAKASKGDGKSTGTVVVNGVMAALYLPELGRDLRALPTVVADIVTEAGAIATVAQTLQQNVTDSSVAVFGDAANLLGGVGSALPSLDVLLEMGQTLAPGEKATTKKKRAPRKSRPAR
jgi:hypothetical protein